MFFIFIVNLQRRATLYTVKNESPSSLDLLVEKIGISGNSSQSHENFFENSLLLLSGVMIEEFEEIMDGLMR